MKSASYYSLNCIVNSVHIGVEGGEGLIASKHIPLRKLLSENATKATTARSASRSGGSNKINKDLASDLSLLHLGEGERKILNYIVKFCILLYV